MRTADNREELFPRFERAAAKQLALDALSMILDAPVEVAYTPEQLRAILEEEIAEMGFAEAERRSELFIAETPA